MWIVTLMLRSKRWYERIARSEGLPGLSWSPSYSIYCEKGGVRASSMQDLYSVRELRKIKGTDGISVEAL